MPATRPDEGSGALSTSAAFVELGKVMLSERTLNETLRRICELAKSTLPGTEDVSITVVEPDGEPRTVVFTGKLAADLDERQYALGFGPCLKAAATGETITVDFDDGQSHFGAFGKAALRAGVHHTVSIGMPLPQRVVGGLNIYGSDLLPFDSDVVDVAQAFAGHAAILVANATDYENAVDLSTQLRTAMESRATIEQAKGIVMLRDRCSPDEAFATLRSTSQRQNVKLRDVARRLVDAVQSEKRSLRS